MLLNAGQLHLAAEEYATAEALGDDGPGPRFYRGEAYARQARWVEAEAQLLRAMDWPDAPLLTVASAGGNLALLRLHRGDEAGYRQVCGSLLQRCGPSKEPWVQRRVISACVLAPGAVERPADLVALAERHMASPAVSRGDALGLLGCALYRAGRDRECLQRLAEARQAVGLFDTGGSWMFAPLARYRLEQAKPTPQEVQALTPGIPLTGADQLSPWRVDLEREVARRELAPLLGSP
jgi:hypothetical protein